jgi:uncharacterized membrane protein YgdD (TMEM256/DUF423 family)
MPAGAKLILSLGALLGAAAVVLGAFGAHALKARLAPEMLAVWQTAVQYHFWHVLALLAVGALALHLPESRWLHGAAGLFVLGILSFSGSLYLLSLGAPRALGIVTPLGGLAFILGWLALAIGVLRA